MLCYFQVYSKVIQIYLYISIYLYLYLFFFRFFSIIGYYKILNIVSCAIQLVLVVYLFYIQKYMLLIITPYDHRCGSVRYGERAARW